MMVDPSNSEGSLLETFYTQKECELTSVNRGQHVHVCKHSWLRCWIYSMLVSAALTGQIEDTNL